MVWSMDRMELVRSAYDPYSLSQARTYPALARKKTTVTIRKMRSNMRLLFLVG